MMLSNLVLETYPAWALIIAAIMTALIGSLVIGVALYVSYRSKNRRVGTREYRFSSRRRFWPWALFLAVLLSGCMERAVIVPPTVPVRLAQHLSGVAVWVKDTNGKEVKARADLFPGMIIATDPHDFPTITRAKFMNLRRDE